MEVPVARALTLRLTFTFTFTLISIAAGCGEGGGELPAAADGGARGDAGIASIRRGNRCANNADCAPGDVCFHDRCAAARTEGQSCEYGGQCRRSPAPLLFCVDERCSPCADRCPARTVCDPTSGDCKLRLGAPCAADGDCRSGLCCPARRVCGRPGGCPGVAPAAATVARTATDPVSGSEAR